MYQRSSIGHSKPPAGAQINWTDPLAQGLAIAIPLNEGQQGSGNSAACDVIVDTARGVVCASTNTSTTFWTPTQKGLALQFPAANGEFSIGGLKGLTQKCSFLCRMALGTAPPSAACIFGSGTGGVIWGINSARTMRFQKAGVGIIGSSSTALTLGQFYDIGVSYDGATVRFYVDGKADGTAASTATLAETNWQFGADGTNATELAQDAKVIHAYAWVGRALTADDFRTLTAQPYRIFAPSSPRRFFTAAPTPITAVVKGKGKGIPPLRVPSSGSATFAALSQAVFAVAADFDGTAILYNGAGVSQGSMTQDARANNSGKVQSLIFSKYVPSAGSYYAIFTMSSAGNAAGALMEIANVAAASQLDQTAVATGSSTSPSSGATAATAQAYEIVVGAIGTEGPGGDTQGSWSNSFQPVAYVGTTGGAAASNVSLSLGYKIVSATGAQTAAKTGITSRQWGAATATYKGLVASAPAADPVTYFTTSPLTAGAVGDMYSEYFEVYGGVAPYTYAVQSGSLPGGLSLATDGALYGIPTLAGVYTFNVRATDSAAETEDLACSLTIAAASATRRKPRTHILTMPGRFF